MAARSCYGSWNLSEHYVLGAPAPARHWLRIRRQCAAEAQERHPPGCLDNETQAVLDQAVLDKDGLDSGGAGFGR